MVLAKEHHELYKELGSIVGARYVSDAHAVLLSYTRDVSTFPPGRPQGVVVRPGSVDEVVELVRLANQTRIPIIPMGGKASISGVPPGQPGRGIIVDMKRMDKVIEIDEENMAVTAQCGITLGEMMGKVNKKGFGIHTGSMPHYVCTLGGHMSGIPGAGFGDYGFSIGFNWHYVLGMKVVLPNASIVDTGTGEGSLNTYQGHTWARSMMGPDVTGMFIGDGGIFGIKVEATYRMFRLPKFKKAGFRCWDTLDEAYSALHELWDIDPFLYMQPYVAALILTPESLTLATGGAAKPSYTILFKAIGNTEEEVELKFRTTEEMLMKHGGREVDPATAALASNYESGTKDMGRLSTIGQFPLFELIVPRRDILEAFKWTRDFIDNGLRERGINKEEITFLGALLPAGTGYGMTSLVPGVDMSNGELHKKIHGMLLEWLQEAVRRGYSPESTQGHESRLKAKQWTSEYYTYILTLKKALDPNNIMNPGVFFA